MYIEEYRFHRDHIIKFYVLHYDKESQISHCISIMDLLIRIKEGRVTDLQQFSACNSLKPFLCTLLNILHSDYLT